MATSKCPCCGRTQFEMKEAEIKYSRFKLMFIQCASCGAVVGTMDFYNIGNAIHKLASGLHIDIER